MKKIKKSSTAAVLLFWIFLAVPFALVVLDWAAGREREFTDILEKSDRDSLNLIHNLQVSASNEYQIINRLTGFQRQLQEKIVANQQGDHKEVVESLYKDFLRDEIPLHHLAVAVKADEKSLLNTVFAASTASGANLLNSFAPLMDAEPCENSQYENAGNDLLQMTGFPVNSRDITSLQHIIKSKNEGIMLPFTSFDRCTWFYWFYPRTEKSRVLVCAVFDMKDIGPDYSFRAAADLIDSSRRGIAFLSAKSGQQHRWSGFFADKPELRNHLNRAVKSLPLYRLQDYFSSYRLFSVPAMVGEDAIMVLAVKNPAKSAISFYEMLFLLSIVAIFFVISFQLWQRQIFSRGWRVSIGLVIFSATFSVFYLPAGIGRMVARSALDDQVAEMSAEAEEGLERNMQVLEDRFHLVMADFFHRLHRPQDYPRLQEAVLSERFEDALKFFCSDVKAKYPKEMNNSLIFTNVQNDAGQTVLLIKNQGRHGLSEMFAPLFRSLLLKFRPDLLEKKATAQGLSLRDVKDEMVTDFLVQFFQGVLGRELYHHLMANPTSLVQARSSFTMASTSVIPFFANGVVRAMIMAIWSEFEEEEIYLDFLIDKPSEKAANFEFMALRKSAFQNFYRESSKMPPHVWDLAEKSRRVDIQLTSREMLDSEGLLIKSQPGDSLGLYILTGVTSLKSIFLRQMQLENGFNRLVQFGSVMVIILVILAYRMFMWPLRQLQEGLEKIRAGDFSYQLPVTGSNDEFERIRLAFNSMATGLNEGSLLGKFVSSAVLKVVRSKEAFAKALKGEKRQMTIIFASIRKPEEHSESLKHLAFHLEACLNELRQTEGIIDKVIEEKILMFFDHEVCGGEHAAVEQCLGLIERVRTRMENAGFSGYWGIATGSVIAGILGARNIRLDYTVIGDTVNLSARLNAVAKETAGFSTVVDEETARFADRQEKIAEMGVLKIKGKSEPVKVFRLI